MKFHQQPDLPGFDDMIRLLRVMTEPEMYTEALTNLEQMRDAVNAAISGRERLSQLDAIEAHAKQQQEAAVSALSGARLEAERIVAEAKANAAGIFAREDEARANAVRMLEEAQAHRDAIAAELLARENDLREAERQCNERLSAARKLYGEATTLKEEYEMRLAKLKQAMG